MVLTYALQVDLEAKESVVKACEDERKELGSVAHLQERKAKLANELREKRKTFRTCEVLRFPSTFTSTLS